MKKRIVCIIIAFMLSFLSVAVIIEPMSASAKGSYFYADLFTPDRSKKGTQSFKPSETINTSNIFLNVFMETSFPKDDRSDISQYTAWTFEGETYYFKIPEGLYDTGTVGRLNDSNFTVTVQLLLRYDAAKLRLIEPTARSYPGMPYYSPNMTEVSVVKEYRAYFDFLSELFSQYRCHVEAWVCGNEVNVPADWNFFGSDCMANVGSGWIVSNSDLLMEHYTKFYDYVYDAVKNKNKNARICICVDHCWNESDGGKIVPTKKFIDLFASKEGNDKDWCIAFHCYPADLNQTDIWSRHQYNPKNVNAQFVDGYNLEILTGYVKDNYGTKHRILLTEQGFADSCGNDKQAACLVYTYYKAKFDDMIDVMHVMKFEGSGFELNEPAATIWKYLDDGDPSHEQWIFDQVKGTIGISSWKDITPNWKSEGELQKERNAYKAKTRCIFNEVDYSPVFDFDYYVANNPTVVGYFTLDPINNPPTFEDMFFYFSRYGMDYGQASSPNFDLAKYKNDNPDLVALYGDDNRSYYTHFCVADEAAKSERVKAFVNRFYQTIQGREGEEEGLDFWTNNLLKGNFTGADVAKEFVLSDEFKGKNHTNREFLNIMYQAFFGRAADSEGFDFWVDNLHAGCSKEYVVACFVDSEEFTGICNSYGITRGDLDKNEGQPAGPISYPPLKMNSDNVNDAQLSAYVEKLYTTILDRPSEAEGCEYWKKAIKEGKGADAGTAAGFFFKSTEYRNKNKSDEEFLIDVYEMFFGRDPRATGDYEGYNYWLKELKEGNISRTMMVEYGFGQSNEFKGILRSYGFEIVE